MAQENVVNDNDTQHPEEPKFRYNAQLAQSIEKKWQHYWDEHGTFWAANIKGDLVDGTHQHADGRSPYFVIDMFPYPSGKGLHVGHPLGYLATDVVSRYHRMKGENVLHAMGYDAFGLPAEQYAVQTGQHPRVTTEANIANMSRQLYRMGLSFDKRRTFATIDPEYVRWTQWIFSRIYDSWYDPEYVRADGGKGSARPIAELIEAFASGRKSLADVPNVDSGIATKTWSELTRVEQADVLNEYRLAYISKSPVNWCPGLGTVLANEEVTAEGRSERGNYPVFRRELRQWSMRITQYGHRLIADLDGIDWPDKVKSMQRNWIGESHGASVHFSVPTAHQEQDLEVYTTRPDTLFGACFATVSPEHPLLEFVPDQWPENIPDAWKNGAATPTEAVADYVRECREQRVSKAGEVSTEKTGVFTGLYAINPVNGKPLPIFTADYVLMDYGTGAIMAVPGGDQRDFDFAMAHDIPVDYVTAPLPDSQETLDDYIGKAPFVSYDGVLVNSSTSSAYANKEAIDLNGMTVEEAKQCMIAWIERAGVGTGKVSYRLRDWLFSRQRYWGEPFPIVYDKEGVAHLLPDSALPISLPDVPDYSPKTFDPEDADSNPEAPLTRNNDWVHVTLDLGDGPQEYTRDTNTMPNWAGSCWYYLRYIDPSDSAHAVDAEEYNYWMGAQHNASSGDFGGVDLYVGGVEHAVLHLLYARFWHKVLFDLGYVSTPEPFHKLFNQGYIQAYAYTDDRGQYVPAAEVQEEISADGSSVFTWNGEVVHREFGKMGKSLKNIVTPDDMYDNFGADTFRLYEMSMGPLAESRPWNMRNVVGSMRFLQRLWRNVVDEETGEVTVADCEPDEKTLRLLHRTIADVTEEMEQMRPNTAISKLIVLNNHLTSLPSHQVPRSVIEPLVLMLAPIAPHIAEELWSKLGHDKSLSAYPWPVAQEEYLGVELVTAVVQIQGKVRAKLEVAPDIAPEELEAKALALPAVQERLGGNPPRKVIVKAPKIVSIVPQQ